MQTALLIALLCLSISAPADDLFFADGRIVTTRTMTWQGKTLEAVQLGARTATGLAIHHRDGVARVPVASLSIRPAETRGNARENGPRRA